MEVNKDKGTTVGFSENYRNKKLDMTQPCGEFVKNNSVREQKCICEVGHPYNNLACPIHGFANKYEAEKPIDFKIPENLKQIEDKECDDIWIEFTASKEYKKCLSCFYKYLAENYLPPKQKNNGNKKS